MKLWIVLIALTLIFTPAALATPEREGSADDAPPIVIYGKDSDGVIRPIRTDADGVVQTA